MVLAAETRQHPFTLSVERGRSALLGPAWLGVGAIVTWALLGALVRVVGSSVACSGWPSCTSELLPPQELGDVFAWGQVLAAAVAHGAAVWLLLAAWRTAHADPASLGLAAGLVATLGLRSLLGTSLDMADLNSQAAVVRSQTLFAALAAFAWVGLAGPRPAPALPRNGTLLSVAILGAIVLAATLILGAMVRAQGAGWACTGFPSCNGQGLLPFGRGSGLLDLNLAHRAASYGALIISGVLVWLAWSAADDGPLRRGAALLAMGLGTSAVAGGLGAMLTMPAELSGAHTVGSLLSVLGLTAVTRRLVELSSTTPAVPAPVQGRVAVSIRARVGAYVVLTKPKVMSLLLLTTLAAMVMAEGGIPHPGLIFWTVVGGALASGGAGAINHYLDRDIDPLMGRTAQRPIPAGVVEPWQALWFGIALGALAFVVYVAFVNTLAGLLAMAGLFFYVFVYTMWMKRTTPSNIVIGGAAGSFPPMVGWAAVADEVGLTALYLFAIVFFWTPPHFWALSLMIRQHYERAKVPMLPVVRGDEETRWQILLYTVLLVVLTLVLTPFGLMGNLYFVSALVLGGLFLRDAYHLWQARTLQAAKRLYLTSMLYLAVLFVAMAADRVAARMGLL